jgi:hypothetical protein
MPRLPSAVFDCAVQRSTQTLICGHHLWSHLLHFQESLTHSLSRLIRWQMPQSRHGFTGLVWPSFVLYHNALRQAQLI